VVEALSVASAEPAPTPPATAEPAPGAHPVTAEPEPAGPVRLRRGTFRGIDHRAEGEVSIYRRPDGRHVVGLEDFDIQPGPDYDVYLVSGAERTDTSGGVRLDDLRGNQGTQFYDVPAGTEIGDGSWTVLVWCQRFAVPVAHATPT
ncbi:MAG: DM13 domain-containing protein, partial [Acidimicrobiia bacterium]